MYVPYLVASVSSVTKGKEPEMESRTFLSVSLTSMVVVGPIVRAFVLAIGDAAIHEWVPIMLSSNVRT